MKDKYLIIVMLVLFSTQAMPQGLNFYSGDLSAAVKNELGLDSNAVITQEIADEVTVLNLEGYGITDIRDIIYFPYLQELNLSYNGIRDISPLLELRSLHSLDIQSNFLETVDLLALSESLQMTVILSANYIKDFYALTHSPHCLFTIIGMNLQYPTTYEVRELYTDYNLQDMSGIVTCDFWSLHPHDTFLVKNSNSQRLVLPDTLQKVSTSANGVVYLQTGEQAMDSSYFVPITTLETHADSIWITPLFSPEDYVILSVEAIHSEVSFANDSIFLYKPQDIVNDTVKVGFGICYGNGTQRLKGYTYYLITHKETAIDEVLAKEISIYPNPVRDELKIETGDLQINTIQIVDLTGKVIYHSSQMINNSINVSTLSAGVYLIKVDTDKGMKTEKFVKN
jgi:hypothetical protein